MIKLYNTLSRKKETFKPIKEKEVGIYTCGPTAYWYAHIGNLRTFITSDIIKRIFLFNGYKVRHVMNITDVDDKTIKGSRKENLSLKEFTKKYEKAFLEDIEKLNIIRPDIMPRATEHVREMIELIKILLKKGYAYRADDGIYFSVNKFKGYGKLANIKKVESKSRIKNDEYDKENLQDFALWKFYTKEDGNIFWEAEFGKGRPGWHIECSTMSVKYLGQPFDIHTGAIDLIFPHHTNEIAQSEAAAGKKFVNAWMHAGFLTMKEGKMSKSLGNIYTLNDLKERRFEPLEYRYLTLLSHYRSPMLFSWENMKNARNAYERLKNITENLKDDKKINEKYLNKFKEAVNDDFDMPKALSILWEMLRDSDASGKYQAIKEMDRVLGLNILKKDKIAIPEEIQVLGKEREKARKSKDWKLADKIREKIRQKGWLVEDTPKGQLIKKT